jgi:hypothetical protein
MTPHGYNLRQGGSRGRPSEETRRKISESEKGKHSTPRTRETRAKISLANLGRLVSEETREKIAIAKRGIARSEEIKKKISESLRLRKASLKNDEPSQGVDSAHRN